jgi:hypothetical protein
MRSSKPESKKKMIEFLNFLIKEFQKAYKDKNWLFSQGEKYLKDAEEIRIKRFESWKGTFTKFVR